MKRLVLFVIVGMALVICPMMLQAGETGPEALIPAIDGWKLKAKPDTYTPDNLFEYINGAADVFLSYDFQELTAATLVNDNKNTVTVDIYRHSNPRNGFGIYSQEKPRGGGFLEIGTQGYYEKGILNFLKGVYYVKISAFDLGDQDRTILETIAKKTAQHLKGENIFPKALQSFASKGKIENSEHYIAKDFLGHSFLHSAYVANYKGNEDTFQVFLIDAGTSEAAREIVDNYLSFAKKKGKTVNEDKAHGCYRFQDPYYRSKGDMNIKVQGQYVWGLFSKSSDLAGFHIDSIGQNLLKNKLLK